MIECVVVFGFKLWTYNPEAVRDCSLEDFIETIRLRCRSEFLDCQTFRKQPARAIGRYTSGIG